MKQVKRAFALLMCVATVLSLCMVYASAGNVCSENDVKGDVNTTVTFYVNTTSKWKLSKDKIKLTATSGTLIYQAYSASGATTDSYGFYEVSWYKKSGKSWKSVSSKIWDNTETCSISSLKKSTNYKITVRPLTMDEIYEKHRIRYASNALCPVLVLGTTWDDGRDFYDQLCKPADGELKWDSANIPTWTVSKATSGIMTCSK